MQLRKIKQILQALADDTRLRIVNLVQEKELSVTEICDVLDCQQSNISKHLSRLRLSGVVTDRREGLNVFYTLTKPKEKAYKKLLSAITMVFEENEVFRMDSEKLNKLVENNKKVEDSS